MANFKTYKYNIGATPFEVVSVFLDQPSNVILKNAGYSVLHLQDATAKDHSFNHFSLEKSGYLDWIVQPGHLSIWARSPTGGGDLEILLLEGIQS